MYIMVSFDMPSVFKERMPFENKTPKDTPLYTKSIAVFQTEVDITEQFQFKLETLEFTGFVPFVNTKVSNSSPHSILRGKSFNPNILYGIAQDYKATSTWKHKAIYLFNDTLVNSEKVTLYGKQGVIKVKESVSKLILDGSIRCVKTAFVNPLWKEKYMVGCNIHRGPRKNKGTDNKSLGCVTVEQDIFDGIMKFIDYNELVCYVHHIDELINMKECSSYSDTTKMNYNFINIIYNSIIANINQLVRK